MSAPLPRGACDSHCHVIGPHTRFPLAPGAGDIRSDDPAKHLALLAQIGLDRALVVHPSSVYAGNHDALMVALTAGGSHYRGVAVANADVTDGQLDAWRDAGVCALRFVEVQSPQGGRFAGSASFDDLEALAPRLKERGMHAQIWAECRDLLARADRLARLGLPLVLDHLGRPEVAAGALGADFRTLCEHVRNGDFYVKLTLCRNSHAKPDYDELRPFHDSLVEANPKRMLWGSDWPHLRMGEAAPNAAELLALFRRWVSDAEIEYMALVHNPERLFGFPPVEEA